MRLSLLAVLSRVLTVPYTLSLALIVWLPSSQASRVTGIVDLLAAAIAKRLHLSFATTYTVLEFSANVVLFVPFGILLALGWPRLRTWHLALLGLLTSGVIEFVQLYMPSRFSTVSDLIANTAGAAVGCLIVKSIVWLASVPVPSRAERQQAAESGVGSIRWVND